MHRGRPTVYQTNNKNNIWKWHYFYFKSKNCFHSNSHRLQFPRNNNAFRRRSRDHFSTVCGFL